MAQKSLLQYTSCKKALDKLNFESICVQKKNQEKPTNPQLHHFTKYLKNDQRLGVNSLDLTELK